MQFMVAYQAGSCIETLVEYLCFEFHFHWISPAPEIVVISVMHKYYICIEYNTYSNTIEVGWFHIAHHSLQQCSVAVGVVLKSKAGVVICQICAYYMV